SSSVPPHYVFKHMLGPKNYSRSGPYSPSHRRESSRAGPGANRPASSARTGSRASVASASRASPLRVRRVTEPRPSPRTPAPPPRPWPLRRGAGPRGGGRRVDHAARDRAARGAGGVHAAQDAQHVVLAVRDPERCERPFAPRVEPGRSQQQVDPRLVHGIRERPSLLEPPQERPAHAPPRRPWRHWGQHTIRQKAQRTTIRRGGGHAGSSAAHCSDRADPWITLTEWSPAYGARPARTPCPRRIASALTAESRSIPSSRRRGPLRRLRPDRSRPWR